MTILFNFVYFLLFYTVLYFSIGTVPSSLCDIGTLSYLKITDSGSNPLLTCAPLCLTSVNTRTLPSTVLETCPSDQDNSLCSLIAATNIESIASKTMWSCTSDGVTSTNPCSSWSGISCSGGSIVQLYLNSLGLTGILM